MVLWYIQVMQDSLRSSAYVMPDLSYFGFGVYLQVLKFTTN